MRLTLTSQRLRATIDPARGGSIATLHDRADDGPLLFTTAPSAPPAHAVALGLEDWIAQYAGGWQTVLPNGGDACRAGGVDHGWHGEASVAPWLVEHQAPSGCTLALQLHTAPLLVRRTIDLTGSRVEITETVHNQADAPVRLMWSHHPALGGALLEAGKAQITANATSWRPDTRALHAGPHPTPQGGTWPPTGEDAFWATVEPGLARLAYLDGFPATAWAALRRPDGYGVALAWDATTLPAMWLWVETGGTTGWPWHGQARTVGLEPASTTPAHGLANAPVDRLLTLPPLSRHETWVTLHLIDPGEQVAGATRHALTAPATIEGGAA
jgi:hypothetical protein